MNAGLWHTCAVWAEAHVTLLSSTQSRPTSRLNNRISYSLKERVRVIRARRESGPGASRIAQTRRKSLLSRCPTHAPSVIVGAAGRRSRNPPVIARGGVTGASCRVDCRRIRWRLAGSSAARAALGAPGICQDERVSLTVNQGGTTGVTLVPVRQGGSFFVGVFRRA